MQTSSSLYRKYRSQTFDELVGQEPVVRTLKNAIAAGRISHAYLFTGPRGVGKTSAARLLARAANCTSEGVEKPCNQCPNCLAGSREITTDLIEIDAASNTGVDNIREIIERANFAPSVWNTKFYIIDEVHMLSTSAFNALLKTLEEPPPHTAFILATTEVHKVPATVASRCQRFDFRRVPLKATIARLQYICSEEGIEVELAALDLVARQATGSLRDALSLLDQLRVFADQTITTESVRDMLGAGGSEEVASFVDVLIARDIATGLRQINGILEEGLDLRQFNRQVVDHLRYLMLVKSGAAALEGGLLDVTDEMKQRLQKQAEGVKMADLLRWVKIFSEVDTALRSSVYSQLPLEMALVAASLPAEEATPQQPVKDRSNELAQAAAQVAAPPEQRTPKRPAAEQSRQAAGPPPPLHTEFDTMVSNGRQDHAPDDVPPVEMPEPTSGEDSPEGQMSVAEKSRTNDSASDASSSQPGSGAKESKELQRLVDLWGDVVDQINARSPALASFFRNQENVRPVAVSGSTCTIAFRHHFHAKQTMTNEPGKPRRDVIEAALSKVLGYKCLLESTTFEEAGIGDASGKDASPNAGNKRTPVKEKSTPYDTPRGKAAMNIFDIDKFDDPQ